MPQPVLSLAYLIGIRAERLRPSFVPIVLLAALPLASALAGVCALRRGGAAARRWHLGLLGVAVLELAWTALAAAMVGFAIAWRSG